MAFCCSEQSVTAIVPAQVVNSRPFGTCTDDARLRQMAGRVIVLPTLPASHSRKVEQQNVEFFLLQQGNKLCLFGVETKHLDVKKTRINSGQNILLLTSEKSFTLTSKVSKYYALIITWTVSGLLKKSHSTLTKERLLRHGLTNASIRNLIVKFCSNLVKSTVHKSRHVS